MKRENTVNKKLKNPVQLPGRIVTEIWFDLKHIQHGWDTVTKDYATIAYSGSNRPDIPAVTGHRFR
jgi:hypothetical protein